MGSYINTVICQALLESDDIRYFQDQNLMIVVSKTISPQSLFRSCSGAFDCIRRTSRVMNERSMSTFFFFLFCTVSVVWAVLTTTRWSADLGAEEKCCIRLCHQCAPGNRKSVFYLPIDKPVNPTWQLTFCWDTIFWLTQFCWCNLRPWYSLGELFVWRTWKNTKKYQNAKLGSYD